MRFLRKEVEFVGFGVSSNGISMAVEKRGTIASWGVPRTKRGLQSFLGFTNFYRSFIRDYARIANPLYEMLKTRTLYWTDRELQSFRKLKMAFEEDVRLEFPKFDQYFVVTGDASDSALSVVLSQSQSRPEPGIIPPDRRVVAFHSRKLTPAEANLDIGEKETLPMVEAILHWRAWLLSAPHVITFYTDHKNLDRLTETRKLSRKNARWLKLFAEINMKVS